MRFSVKSIPAIAGLLGLGFVQATSDAVRQIAIIGAGAGGASTAYFLHQFAEEAGVNVNITLFEKTDHIGGRTRTINPFDDPTQRIEQGASIFVQVNQIMYNAMTEFGLAARESDPDAEPTVGIWDGNNLVFTINQGSSSWWNTMKVIWRYGWSRPQKAQQLTADVIGKFLRIYEPEFFPFESLTQRAQQLGLAEVTKLTGQELLDNNGAGGLYAHDLIQASTRVNYASNLANLHGLTTMVSLAAEGAVAIQGGNWQIFHEMARRSGAQLALNTTVAKIDKAPAGKYTVQTKSTSPHGKPTTHSDTFDNVVVAGPFQFSGITAGKGVFEKPLEKIDYVKLHVTIFSSASRPSPRYFNLADSAKAPAMILTTLADGDGPDSGVEGAGTSGFYSFSVTGTAINPATNQKENVYKIFSPEAVTPELLSRLFGANVPSSVTGEDSPISWYVPHVFHSYPKTSPRTTFEDPVVGSGVYYTSGMESFISTMETNALAGKNIARLIIDSMQVTPTGPVEVKTRDALMWEQVQNVLG